MKFRPPHYIILTFAILAVLGSLYYQFFGDYVTNIMSGNLFPPNTGYLPCVMCFWQRIFMYPIALIAVIALITKDTNFTKYTAALSGIGMLFSMYHYYIQKVPVANSPSCSLDNPCSASEVNYLGFITIPFEALIAFVAIFVASLVWEYTKNRSQALPK